MHALARAEQVWDGLVVDAQAIPGEDGADVDDGVGVGLARGVPRQELCERVGELNEARFRGVSSEEHDAPPPIRNHEVAEVSRLGVRDGDGLDRFEALVGVSVRVIDR
jgi:hypothetical protein